MRTLLLAAALLPAAAAADVVQPQKGCVPDARVEVAARAGQDGFRRLDRLPPASEFLTVYREVGHCPKPVVVADHIGRTQR